jgi:hypothetical protein
MAKRKTPTTFSIDHLAYLSSRRYRRQLHADLKGGKRFLRGTSQMMNVIHEDDSSCCRWEAWNVTARRIVAAVAGDGESMLWLLPDATVTGVPSGQEERLRENFKRAAGGPLQKLGPVARARRDHTLQAWEAAGARFCPHIGATPRMLMAHAPDEIRCALCTAAYAQTHQDDLAESTCDYCGVQSDDLTFVTGPFFGIVLSAAACSQCADAVKAERGERTGESPEQIEPDV